MAGNWESRTPPVFAVWVVSKTDDDFRAMTNRGVLSRKEVAKECGFAKSALDQNPRIKAALRDLEDAPAPARRSCHQRSNATLRRRRHP